MNNNIFISTKLLLEFLLTFSKFEYALKASGYFTMRNASSNDAIPNWRRFKNKMQNELQIDRDEELQKACQYILDYPPKKQVIVNNSLQWELSEPQNRQDVKFLVEMVRCVRNNLFHGGKHNNKDTQRKELLLRNGLIILRECLRLEPMVKEKFEKAII